MTAESGLREVVWQLALELGKVTGDTSDVETPQDRHLGFAIKQELEHRLDAMLRRVRACRQSLAEIERPGFGPAICGQTVEDEWVLAKVAIAGLAPALLPVSRRTMPSAPPARDALLLYHDSVTQCARGHTHPALERHGGSCGCECRKP
jgi:hypothetical protein